MTDIEGLSFVWLVKQFFNTRTAQGVVLTAQHFKIHVTVKLKVQHLIFMTFFYSLFLHIVNFGVWGTKRKENMDCVINFHCCTLKCVLLISKLYIFYLYDLK